MAINKQLAPAEFELAAERTPLQPLGIEIARCVMVDKELQSVVGKRYNLGSPSVSRYVSIIWNAHVQSMTLPAGWEEVTAILPEDKVAIVRTWESESRTARLKNQATK